MIPELNAECNDCALAAAASPSVMRTVATDTHVFFIYDLSVTVAGLRRRIRPQGSFVDRDANDARMERVGQGGERRGTW